jgi:hypothetical protein
LHYLEVVGSYLFSPVTTYRGSRDYRRWIQRQLRPDNDSIETGLVRFQFELDRIRNNRLPLAFRRMIDVWRLGARSFPTILVTNIQFTESDALFEAMQRLKIESMGTRQIRFLGYFAPYVVVTTQDDNYSVRIHHSLLHLSQEASMRFLETLPRSIRFVAECNPNLTIT